MSKNYKYSWFLSFEQELKYIGCAQNGYSETFVPISKYSQGFERGTPTAARAGS